MSTKSRPRIYRSQRLGREVQPLRKDADESVVPPNDGALNDRVLLEPPAPALSLHPPDRKKFEVVLDPKNPECLASVVRRYIETIFDQCGQNKAKTAEALGVGRTTIYRKLGLRKD